MYQKIFPLKQILHVAMSMCVGIPDQLIQCVPVGAMSGCAQTPGKPG